MNNGNSQYPVVRLLSRVSSASIAALSNSNWLPAVRDSADIARTPRIGRRLAPLLPLTHPESSALRLVTDHPPQIQTRETPEIQYTLLYAFQVPTVRRIALLLSSYSKFLQPVGRQASASNVRLIES